MFELVNPCELIQFITIIIIVITRLVTQPLKTITVSCPGIDHRLFQGIGAGQQMHNLELEWKLQKHPAQHPTTLQD